MADVTIDIKKEDGTILTLDKNYITDITSLSQSTSDASNINYGTIANSGSIQISDGDGYIASLIDDGTLPTSNLDVKIKLNGNVIQEHITTDATYETEDNTLSISMSNFIKDFDELKYKGYPYPDTSKSVYDLLYDVLYTYFRPQYTSETYPDFIDDMFDDDLLTYIKNITIQYPVIEYGKTYREVIDSLCTIAQMNMFSTPQNLPKFVSSRPVYSNIDTINQLEWINVRDNLKYTKPVKNKFDGVEISKTNVVDAINYVDVVNTGKGDISSYSYSSFVGTNPTLFDATYGVGGKIEDYYSSGNYSFAMKSENNLQQIIEVLQTGSADSEGYYNIQLHNDNLPYSVTYNKYSGWFNNEQQALTDIQRDSGSAPYPDPPYTNSVFLRTEYSGNVTFGSVEESYSGRIPVRFTVVTYNEISLPDNSWIKVKVDKANGIVYVKYNLLSQSVYYNLQTNHFNNFRNGSFINKYSAVSYDISIYGDRRTITFEEQSASTTNIESAKTKATVNSSELLQNTTIYNGIEIADIIKENILTDYRRGIETGSFAVNANIVEIGDLVKYPDDNRVWRVTGKQFVYDGGIEFPLEVMQCYKKSALYGLFDEDDELIYSWNDLVANNLVTVDGTSLQSVDNSIEGVLKIKNGLTSIGGANGCTGLSGIVIPESVTEIRNSAFSGCTGLTKIEYNATNVTDKTSNNYVFYNAGSNSDGITLKIGSNVTKMPAYLFNPVYNGSVNIKSVIFLQSSSCSTIGENCFARCQSITSCNLPNSIETIGRGAFNQTGLTSVTIPNSVTSVGDEAFYKCESLTSIVFSDNMSTIARGLFGYCSALTNVNIPDNITTIADYAFQHCTNLVSVHISDFVTSIGQGMFVECTSLTTVNLPTNNSFTTIPSYMFDSCIMLETLTIPSNVTEISINAFYYCIKLKTQIPNSVTSIGQGAFSSCMALDDITLPTNNQFTTIATYAFAGCGITSITIPSNVTKISANGFASCRNLTSAVFSDTSGWLYDGSSIDVTDPSTNAMNLRDLKTAKAWTKS